jgi:hypothetical protein
MNHRSEALRAVHAVRDDWGRSRVLRTLSVKLAELGDLGQALEAVRSIEYSWERTSAIVCVAPYLDERTLGRALASARALDNEDERATALASLAMRAARLRRATEAIEAALDIADAWALEDVLASVIPHVDISALDQILAAARTVSIATGTFELFAELAIHVADLGRPAEATNAAEEITDLARRSEVLAQIAQRVGNPDRERLLRHAVNTAHQINEPGPRAATLAGLARSLAELDHPTEALETARSIEDVWWRDKAMESLSFRLATLGHSELAIEAVLGIPAPRLRAKTLITLAPRLPEPYRRKAALEALAAVSTLSTTEIQGLEIESLILQLMDMGRPSDALTAAKWIQDARSRARVLTRISSALEQPEREMSLREASEAASDIHDPYARASASLALIPLVGPSNREQILRDTITAFQTSTKLSRAGVLSTIAHYLVELSCSAEALRVARMIEDAHQRQPTLSRLALQLIKSNFPHEAVEAAFSLRNERPKPEFFKELPYRLNAESTESLLRLWNHAYPGLVRCNREDALVWLQALSPIIKRLGGEEAVSLTCRGIQDVGRWWP